MAETLTDLAKQRFPDLNEIELEILNRFEEGEAISFKNDVSLSDIPINDHKHWPSERTFRAELLSWLCALPSLKSLISHNGIWVVGLAIEGKLDLADMSLDFPLSFAKCVLAEISLERAKLRSLLIFDSRIEKLRLDDAVIEGKFTCTNNTSISKGISGQFLTISQNLELLGASFGIEAEGSLLFDGSRFGGEIRISDVVVNSGFISFSNCQIGGSFRCKKTRVENEKKLAFDLSGSTVAGDVRLTPDVIIQGRTDVSDARITGSIYVTGAQFGDHFNGTQIIVGGVIDFSEIRLNGPLLLFACDVRGNIWFYKANIRRPAEIPEGQPNFLAFYNSRIQGDIFFDEEFVTELPITFDQARINAIHFIGSQLSSHMPTVISGRHLKTQGPVFFSDCRIEGAVDLSNSDISFLNFRGTSIKGNQQNPGVAIQLSGSSIRGNLFFSRGFSCEGSIDLRGTKIAADLEIMDAAILGDQSNIRLDASVVEGVFQFRRLKEAFKGRLVLGYAKLNVIVDDIHSWPSQGKLILDGCTYRGFSGNAPQTPSKRLGWIRLQAQSGDEFSTQPYEQLQRAYITAGRPKDAESIAIERELDRLKHKLRQFERPKWPVGEVTIGGLAKVGFKFLSSTVSSLWALFVFSIYSLLYRRNLTLALAAFFVLLGTVVFHFANTTGLVFPIERIRFYEQGASLQLAAQQYPHFSPFIYSLDTFAPFLDLKHEKLWLIKEDGNLSHLFHFYEWFHIFNGWLLTAILLASFAPGIKRT